MLCAFPTTAQAQDVAATPVAVRLVGPSRITKLEDLHFGDILPGNTGGTITLDTAGNVSTTGTVISMGGNPQAAEFEISRQILLDYPTYNGPLGTDSIVLTHVSQPSATMTLRNFTTDFNRPGFFGLPAYFFQATYDFRIAGTLDVGANQEPGSYVGTFTVTIDYN